MDPEYTVIMVRGNEVEYYGKNHQEVIESMGMIQEKIEEQINDGWETSGGIQSIIIPEGVDENKEPFILLIHAMIKNRKKEIIQPQPQVQQPVQRPRMGFNPFSNPDALAK